MVHVCVCNVHMIIPRDPPNRCREYSEKQGPRASARARSRGRVVKGFVSLLVRRRRRRRAKVNCVLFGYKNTRDGACA